MKMLQRAEAERIPPREIVVSEALGMPGAVLHAVDFEDVIVSQEAMRSLALLARSVLARYELRPEETARAMRGILRSLGREVYWEERTMSLVLCLHACGDEHFVSLPRKVWSMRPEGRPN